MRAYGNYETTDELKSRGRIFTYSAREAGTEKEAAFIVVTYSTFFKTEQEANAARKGWRETIALQKQLAQAAPKHWLPVLATGEEPDAVYYVSEYHPYSLKDLIDRGLRVNPESLYHIISSIIKGLIELQRIANRPHGDLNPDTVWLNGRGRIATMELYLSDLLPKDKWRQGDGARSDFRALGEMIYCLVNGRTAVKSSMKAVPQQEDWSFLGGKATQWLDLCNALLDPYGVYKDQNLETLLRDLKGLKPKPKKSISIGAGAFVLLISIGVYWYVASEREAALAEQVAYEELWIRYCKEYLDWLQTFSNQVYRKKEPTFWKNNTYLKKEVRDPLFARRSHLYPLDIVGIAGDLVIYVQQPPAVLGEKPRLRLKVALAVEFLETLKQDLIQWPLLTELKEALELFHSKRWQAATAEIEPYTQDLVFDRKLFSRLEKITALVQTARQALAQWQELLAAVEPLKATGDPLLVHIDGFLNNEIARVRDLEEFTPSMRRLEKHLENLIQTVQSKRFQKETDFERFKAESFVKDFQAAPTQEDLSRWLNEIKQYRYLIDDPRQSEKEQWQLVIDGIGKNLDELNKVGTQAESQAYQKRLQELEATIVQLERIHGILKNRTRVIEGIKRIFLNLTKLRDDIELTLIEKSPDIGSWLAKNRNASIPVPGPVNKVWIAQRDALLAGKQEADFPDLESFLALRKKFRKTRSFLVDLSDFLPSPTIPPENMRAEVQRALEGASEARSTAALKQLLKLIAWEAQEPTQTLQQLTSSPPAKAIKKAYETFKQQAITLGQSLQRIQYQLAEGIGLEGEPGVFWKEWGRSDLLSVLAGDPLVKSLITQLRQLETISSETNSTLLLSIIKNPSTSLVAAKTVWLRLGQLLSGKAVNRELFSQEVAAYKALRSRLSGALRDQIQSLAHERWLSAVNQMRTRDALELAFKHIEPFGIKPDKLTVPMQFNLFIYDQLIQLENKSFTRAGPDQVVAVRDGLVKQLGPEGKFASLSQEVNPLVETLKALNPFEDVKDTDSSNVGPAAVGWKNESSPDDDTQFAFSWQRYRLEFLSVESAEGTVYYLAKTELPTDLVIDWINENGSWEDFVALLPEILQNYTGFDERLGPRTWIPSEDVSEGITVSEQWLLPSPEWEDQLYPDNFNPGESWQPGLPLQYIPPQLALYIAEAFGCTLPPKDIWEAALNQVDADINKPYWNLRDKTWQREHAYLKETNAIIQSIEVPWPDADSFGADTRIKRGMDAVASTSTDDRFLWYAPVYFSQVPNFVHLIGNVAEYLYDSENKAFYVAGGSALSAPEIKVSQVYPISPEEAQNGFSDVGMRLAFPAPRISPGRQLMKLLKTQPFIVTPE